MESNTEYKVDPIIEVRQLIMGFIDLITFPGETEEKWKENKEALQKDIDQFYPVMLGETDSINHIMDEFLLAWEDYKKEIHNIYHYCRKKPPVSPDFITRLVGLENWIYFNLWCLEQPIAKTYIRPHLEYLRRAYQILRLFKSYIGTSAESREINQWIVCIGNLMTEIDMFYWLKESNLTTAFSLWYDTANLYHNIMQIGSERRDMGFIINQISLMDGQVKSNHLEAIGLAFISAGNFSADGETVYFDPPATVFHIISEYSRLWDPCMESDTRETDS